MRVDGSPLRVRESGGTDSDADRPSSGSPSHRRDGTHVACVGRSQTHAPRPLIAVLEAPRRRGLEEPNETSAGTRGRRTRNGRTHGCGGAVGTGVKFGLHVCTCSDWKNCFPLFSVRIRVTSHLYRQYRERLTARTAVCIPSTGTAAVSSVVDGHPSLSLASVLLGRIDYTCSHPTPNARGRETPPVLPRLATPATNAIRSTRANGPVVLRGYVEPHPGTRHDEPSRTPSVERRVAYHGKRLALSYPARYLDSMPPIVGSILDQRY